MDINSGFEIIAVYVLYETNSNRIKKKGRYSSKYKGNIKIVLINSYYNLHHSNFENRIPDPSFNTYIALICNLQTTLKKIKNR